MLVVLALLFLLSLEQCCAEPATILFTRWSFVSFPKGDPKYSDVTRLTEGVYAGCYVNRVYAVVPSIIRKDNVSAVRSVKERGDLSYEVYPCDENKELCSELHVPESNYTAIKIDFQPTDCHWLDLENDKVFYYEEFRFSYGDHNFHQDRLDRRMPPFSDTTKYATPVLSYTNGTVALAAAVAEGAVHPSCGTCEITMDANEASTTTVNYNPELSVLQGNGKVFLTYTMTTTTTVTVPCRTVPVPSPTTILSPSNALTNPHTPADQELATLWPKLDDQQNEVYVRGDDFEWSDEWSDDGRYTSYDYLEGWKEWEELDEARTIVENVPQAGAAQLNIVADVYASVVGGLSCFCVLSSVMLGVVFIAGYIW